MKILITAGPTREPIDPVRFISNRSSGKMGYAVASVARERAHDVVLISGPVSLEAPEGVEVVKVLTADDMCRAVEERIGWCDALVMVAAVADWRPEQVQAQKMKKSPAAMILRLEPTPDILKAVRPKKGRRLFVGFAAETQNVLEEARRKLRDKGLDLIVVNDVSRPGSGFEADRNQVTLLPRDGAPEPLPLLPKRDVAARIVEWVERHAPAPA
ncbi:MAG: phosphopantothenoylcysteine decarboxylase [Verrucomicrobiota bacterium]